MDDGREVNQQPGEAGPGTELVEQTKAFFLKIALEEFQANQEQYNLDAEFAKTKQNRNHRVLFVVLGTILVAGLFAFAFSRQYEARNNQVRINQQEFEDINLRDILDRSKKLESDLSYQQTLLTNLEANRAAAVKKAQSDLANQLSMLGVRNLTPEELDRESKRASSRLAAALQGIDKEYAPQQEAIEAQIADIQIQIAAIDPQKLKVAEDQAVILNNERRVYDVERERIQTSLEGQITSLTEDYENRLKSQDRFINNLEATAKDTLAKEQARLILLYNPTLEDEQSQALLSAFLNPTRTARYRLQVPPEYLRENLVDQAKVDSVNQALAEYNRVVAIMRHIPFENAMPSVIDQLQDRTLQVADATTALMTDFWKGVKAREATIAEREATIDEREATIEERDATIQDREAQIATLTEEKQTLTEEITKGDAEYQVMLSMLDGTAASHNVDGVVVTPANGQTVTVRFKYGSAPYGSTQFYVVRGNAEVIGAYELEGDGVLASIRSFVSETQAETEQPKKGFSLFGSSSKESAGKVEFSGNDPAALDWVVAIDRYSAWKAESDPKKR